jgi:hypothetical protein
MTDLDIALDGIAHDHPDASPARVERLLRLHYARTSESVAQQMRAIIAERDTRVRLLRERRDTEHLGS